MTDGNIGFTSRTPIHQRGWIIAVRRADKQVLLYQNPPWLYSAQFALCVPSLSSSKVVNFRSLTLSYSLFNAFPVKSKRKISHPFLYKGPTPTDKSKNQRDNTKNATKKKKRKRSDPVLWEKETIPSENDSQDATKNFNYTTIADWVSTEGYSIWTFR